MILSEDSFAVGKIKIENNVFSVPYVYIIIIYDLNVVRLLYRLTLPVYWQ